MKYIRALIISLLLIFNLAVCPAMASSLNTYDSTISNVAQQESSDIHEINPDPEIKPLLAKLFSNNQKIKVTILGEDYLLRKCPKPPKGCFREGE